MLVVKLDEDDSIDHGYLMDEERDEAIHLYETFDDDDDDEEDTVDADDITTKSDEREGPSLDTDTYFPTKNSPETFVTVPFLKKDFKLNLASNFSN